MTPPRCCAFAGGWPGGSGGRRPPAAAAHFARAVEHSHGLAPAERSELLALSAAELDELGHHDESVAAYHEAIELAHECGDVRREGDLLVRMSSPLTAAGRQPEADAATRLAVELLEPLGPSAELLAAYSAMVTTHMLARELEEAGEWGPVRSPWPPRSTTRDLTYTLVQDGTASLIARRPRRRCRPDQGGDVAGASARVARPGHARAVADRIGRR